MKRRKIQRRGFRPTDAPALSIARNLDVPAGKEITVADIQPYALPMHPPCRGKGYLESGGFDKHGVLGSEYRRWACKCATKRFLKAHPEVILEANGRAWWPAKTRPEGGGEPESRYWIKTGSEAPRLRQGATECDCDFEKRKSEK